MIEDNIVKEVKKIAILRYSVLGDYFFGLPSFNALRVTYPEAEIVYLGHSWHKNFIEDRPGPIDRVEVIPAYEGISYSDKGPNKVEQDKFFARMQEEKFDIALQMHGRGHNSNPFIKRLGARVTAGFKHTSAPPLDRWIPYEIYQHQTLRCLEIASLVGGKTYDLMPQIEVQEKDLEEVKPLINDINKPIAIIHPGAHDPRRRWDPRKFARVADYLIEKYGVQVIVTGVDREKNDINLMINTMRNEARIMCGDLTIGGLIALISKASILISNDTGPFHIGVSLRTLTVGIFWVGYALTSAPFYRSWNRVAISWTTHCPKCQAESAKNSITEVEVTDKCDHLVSYVEGVQVDEINNYADELILNYGLKTNLKDKYRFEKKSLRLSKEI